MKKKRIFSAVLATAMLCGCAAPAGPAPDGEVPPSTETAPTLPADAQEGAAALDAGELAKLQALFGSPEQADGTRNFYHMALTSQYDRPEEVNVHALFGAGLGGSEDAGLSDAARTYLKMHTVLNTDRKTWCLPEDRISGVLEQVFGIGLRDVNLLPIHSGVREMFYYEPEQAWFCNAVESPFPEGLTVTHAHRNPDGTVELVYTFGGRHAGHAVLTPAGKLVSNVWPGWKEPTPLLPTPTEELQIQ